MGCRKIIYRQIKLRATILRAARFCLAEIIFTLRAARVDCDLLQTLVNLLHTLES